MRMTPFKKYLRMKPRPMHQSQDRIFQAAVEFIKRREGVSTLDGGVPSWPYDQEPPLWFSTEIMKCCKPYIHHRERDRRRHIRHCNTIGHVAELFLITPEALREAVKKKNLPTLLGMDPWLDKCIANQLED
jgi:hypothetical protein